MNLLILLAIALAGYMAGSIPFGYLIGRCKGIDVRKQGSGNIGATNVGRLLGRAWGILVLLLDALKGFAPVWGLTALSGTWMATDSPPWYLLATQRASVVGLAAVAGHLWPASLGFRGGKGVATGLGVGGALTVLFAEQMLWPMVVAVAVWIVTVLASRYVSIASMAAAVGFGACYLMTVPRAFMVEQAGLTAVSMAFPLLVVLRHWSNIKRLARGEEDKWGR